MNRKLITHAAAILFGTAVFEKGKEKKEWRSALPRCRARSHIGMTDVNQLDAATRVVCALDYQIGGGAYRDAVIDQLLWVQRLLYADSSDEEVRGWLLREQVNLQNLAGLADSTAKGGHSPLSDSVRQNFSTTLLVVGGGVHVGTAELGQDLDGFLAAGP